jgi:hypothetical protein
MQCVCYTRSSIPAGSLSTGSLDCRAGLDAFDIPGSLNDAGLKVLPEATAQALPRKRKRNVPGGVQGSTAGTGHAPQKKIQKKKKSVLPNAAKNAKNATPQPGRPRKVRFCGSNPESHADLFGGSDGTSASEGGDDSESPGYEEAGSVSDSTSGSEDDPSDSDPFADPFAAAAAADPASDSPSDRECLVPARGRPSKALARSRLLLQQHQRSLRLRKKARLEPDAAFKSDPSDPLQPGFSMWDEHAQDSRHDDSRRTGVFVVHALPPDPSDPAAVTAARLVASNGAPLLSPVEPLSHARLRDACGERVVAACLAIVEQAESRALERACARVCAFLCAATDPTHPRGAGVLSLGQLPVGEEIER